MNSHYLMPAGASTPLRRLALLCLPAVFLLLAACRSNPAPDIYVPAAAPTPQASAAQPASEEPLPESQMPAISPAEYRAMVSDFNTKLMDESVILIQIGLYEYNWWGAYPGDPEEVDLDAMVELVMGWLFENFGATADTIAAACDDLMADYTAIVCANVDGGIPDETADLVNTLFSAYYQLYATVTEPSGPLWDFVPMLWSCTHSITTVNAELASTLETSPISFHRPEGSPSASSAHSDILRRRQGHEQETSVPMPYSDRINCRAVLGVCAP